MQEPYIITLNECPQNLDVLKGLEEILVARFDDASAAKLFEKMLEEFGETPKVAKSCVRTIQESIAREVGKVTGVIQR